MTAQEAERRQLARELHDEMGQTLTAIKLNLQALPALDGGAPGAGRLDETLDLVDRVLQQVRDMSLDLRPSLLDDLGLAPALRWYAERLGRRAGLAVSVTAEARARAMRGGSVGLLGMEERAVLLGGRIHIDSAPGRGTEIRASFPLAVEAGAATGPA